MQLLLQVLQSSESRPSQLLQSMLQQSQSQRQQTSSHSFAPLRWRRATRGIDVEIPAERRILSTDDDATHNTASVGRRRWTRLLPQEQSVDTDDISEKEKLAQHPTTEPASPPPSTSSISSYLTPTILFHSAPPFASSAASEQQLATSATACSRSSLSNNASSSSQTEPAQPTTEWLSLQCQPCAVTGPEGGARAFLMGPQPLSVIVCTNRLQHLTTASSSATNKEQQAALQEMEEILTHELIHVHDVRQLRLDLQDCESLAYSEVRAAREAECRHYPDDEKNKRISDPTVSSWFSRSNPTSRRSCVQQTAQTATSNLFPQPTQAKACVRTVFESAWNDTRPFDK
jgi:hypothetical protein